MCEGGRSHIPYLIFQSSLHTGLDLQMVLVDLGVQRRPGDAQQFGGARAVAAGQVQRFAHQHAAEMVQAVFEQVVLVPSGQQAANPGSDTFVAGGFMGVAFLGIAAGGLGDVLQAQGGAAVENQSFLQGVGQLADVARPGVSNLDIIPTYPPDSQALLPL